MWGTSCLSQQAVSCPPPTLTGLELVNGICHLFSSPTDEGWCPSLLWKLISPRTSLQWSFIWFQRGLESDPHVWRRPHLSASVRKRPRVGRLVVTFHLLLIPTLMLQILHANSQRFIFISFVLTFSKVLKVEDVWLFLTFVFIFGFFCYILYIFCFVENRDVE